MARSKTPAIHMTDPTQDPAFHRLGRQKSGYVFGLCGQQRAAAVCTDDFKMVTCGTCLNLYEKKKHNIKHWLTSAIETGLISKDEYLAFWDELEVQRILQS